MDVVESVYNEKGGGYSTMSKSSVISVRLPSEVVNWINERGGASLLKNVVYAYILTQTCGVNSGKKGQLVRSIIDECVDSGISELSTEEENTTPSLKFE